MTSLTRGQNISITIKAERHKAMKTKYKEVKRLEEIKNHFWYDDDWRASITMLGGFHQGEPNREPNTEKDIRGPVSKDINFNPLDLIEAIRDKNENPDDIFHQMLLLSAETIGEIDRDTRESEKFKNRYKAIEKDLWDEMIYLLKEEQDELYRNVELAFGVCLVEDEGLIKDLVSNLAIRKGEFQDRSIDALGYISSFSSSAGRIVAVKALDKITSIIIDLNYFYMQLNYGYEEYEHVYRDKKAINTIGRIAAGCPEAASIIKEKVLDKIASIWLEEGSWKSIKKALELLARIAESSVESAMIITDKMLDKIIELLEDEYIRKKENAGKIKQWDLLDTSSRLYYIWKRQNAAKGLGIIGSCSPETAKIVAEKAADKIVLLLMNSGWRLNNHFMESIKKIVSVSPEAATIVAEKSFNYITAKLNADKVDVRRNALEVIRIIASGSLEASKKFAAEKTMKIIIELLEDDDSIIRSKAEFTLREILSNSPVSAEFFSDEGLEKIIEVSGHDCKGWKVTSFINQIKKSLPGKIRVMSEKTLKKIESLIGSNNREVRRRGITIFIKTSAFLPKIGEILTGEILNEIDDMLEDDDLAIRRVAVNTISAILSNSYSLVEQVVYKIDKMVELLEAKERYIVDATVDTLKNILEKLQNTTLIIIVLKTIMKKIELFLKDKSNQNRNIRSKGIAILGEIVSDSSKAAKILAENMAAKIIKNLKDNDSIVRESTVKTIKKIIASSLDTGKIIAEKTMGDIATMLKDENKDIHKEVLQAIGEIASVTSETAKIAVDKTLDEIIVKLEDDDNYIRREALCTIGKIASSSLEMARITSEKTMCKIMAMLKSEDFVVYSDTAESLGKIAAGCTRELANAIIEKTLEKISYSKVRLEAIQNIVLILPEKTRFIAEKKVDELIHTYEGMKVLRNILKNIKARIIKLPHLSEEFSIKNENSIIKSFQLKNVQYVLIA